MYVYANNELAKKNEDNPIHSNIKKNKILMNKFNQEGKKYIYWNYKTWRKKLKNTIEWHPLIQQ